MRAKMAAPREGRSGRASWRPSLMATSAAQLIAPQLRGIVVRKVGAQQVSALPPARLSYLVTIELISKRRTTPSVISNSSPVSFMTAMCARKWINSQGRICFRRFLGLQMGCAPKRGGLCYRPSLLLQVACRFTPLRELPGPARS
jgi:hypothetical protein